MGFRWNCTSSLTAELFRGARVGEAVRIVLDYYDFLFEHIGLQAGDVFPAVVIRAFVARPVLVLDPW